MFLYEHTPQLEERKVSMLEKIIQCLQPVITLNQLVLDYTERMYVLKKMTVYWGLFNIIKMIS